jgi:tetratricopeptide (TPR) repeat protein
MVRAHTTLARFHASHGRFDDASRELDAVLQRFPGHEDALSLQDALSRRVPPMEDSSGGGARVADAAVAGRSPVGNPPTPPDNPREPRDPREPREPRGQGYDALVEEGERLQTDGRTAQARLVFQQALTQRAGGAEALTGLGYCDLDGHNVSGAISRFRQALATNSRYSEALIGLAEAYSHRGDYRNALETYQQYLQVNPNGSRAGMAQRQIESLRDRLQEQENRRQNQGNPSPGTTEPAPESPPGGAAPGATAPKAG